MKNLLLIIIFVFINKINFATNCDAQLMFSVKNYSWKAVNSTVSNDIIYIEVNSETDSFSFQLLENNDCTTNKIISEIYLDDKLLELPKDGGIIKSGSVGGLYKILIVTPGSSEWFKLFVKVTNPTAVKNEFLTTNLFLYPNPVKENFFVENSKQVAQIKVIDIMGSEVLSIDNTFRKDVLEIDISKLPAGQYFVTFINNNQKLTKKLVKL
jgi:hypothetical protein